MHELLVWSIITLFLSRYSVTSNTVDASDRPAHQVSMSGPKDGLIVLNVRTPGVAEHVQRADIHLWDKSLEFASKQVLGRDGV